MPKETLRVLLFALITLVARMSAAEPPREIEISAKRFSFSPAEITLKKGEPAVLIFSSEDVTHGIKIESWDVRVEFSKGHPARVAVTPQESGDFEGVCSRFCGSGHGRMKLAFHVKE